MSGPVIAIEMPCASWAGPVPQAEQLCRRAAEATLSESGPRLATLPRARLELCVVLADDATVHRLNRRFRGKDKPTNVLSFPAFDGDPARLPPGDAPVPLGDVIVAFETTRAEAVAERKSMADHLAHLVVHGVLHLAGYDHEEEAAAIEMEAVERAVLARLGIADPYAVLDEEAAG